MSFCLEQITFPERRHMGELPTSFHRFYKPTCLDTHSSLTAFCSSVSSRASLDLLSSVIALSAFTLQPNFLKELNILPLVPVQSLKFGFFLLYIPRTVLTLLTAKTCGYISVLNLGLPTFVMYDYFFLLEKIPYSVHHCPVALLATVTSRFQSPLLLCLPVFCLFCEPESIFFNIYTFLLKYS